MIKKLFFDILYILKKDPWNYQNSEYEKEKYQNTIDTLKGCRYKRILEVGCSEGIFTGMLSEIGDEITAIDISPVALKRAKERNRDCGNISFCCMDVEKEEPGGKFDLIICSEVLYYLDDVERIAGIRDRFISWLEDNGYILLVHMRRLADDESGHPPSPLGYPSMGAKTVHKIFSDCENLDLVSENLQDLYTISFFRKK